MKYAKHMPENTSPARAPNDQKAILSSPSGFLAFFNAKMRQAAATTTPMAVRVPKTVRIMLSDRICSLSLSERFSPHRL